jgi:predicted TIM-barrel fold metal-dependent hydrolase
MKFTEFIDLHAHCAIEHCVKYAAGPLKGCNQTSTPKELLEFYDFHGVEKGFLLPQVNVENVIMTQSNEEVLYIARQYPDRFLAFCNIDPRNLSNSASSPFVEVLKQYKDMGCKGIGEICASLRFSDYRVQALFAAAEETRMPVLFHTTPFADVGHGLVDAVCGFPELEQSLKRFPGLKFIGHSRGFWGEISRCDYIDDRFNLPKSPVIEGRLVELFRKYENLYGDLSGEGGLNMIERDRKYAAKFLTEFQDRLMFGLNIRSPEAERARRSKLPAVLAEMCDNGEITRGVFLKIARENALKVLGV